VQTLAKKEKDVRQRLAQQQRELTEVEASLGPLEAEVSSSRVVVEEAKAANSSGHAQNTVSRPGSLQ
jgi:multidrug resistance efflux pump